MLISELPCFSVPCLATKNAEHHMRILASLLENFYREYYHGHDNKPIFVGGLHFQLGHLLAALASMVDPVVRSDCDFSFLNLAEFQVHLDFFIRVAVSEECNSVLSKGRINFNVLKQ